jgi:hypothetical protein
VKLPKGDQQQRAQTIQEASQRAYPPHKAIPDTKYFSGTFTSSVDAQRRLGIEYALQDPHSQLYKFNEKLKNLAKVTTAVQSPPPAQANSPKHPLVISTRVKVVESAAQVKITMSPPAYKGSQVRGKSSLEQRPV